jgi:hypothetical protein
MLANGLVEGWNVQGADQLSVAHDREIGLMVEDRQLGNRAKLLVRVQDRRAAEAQRLAGGDAVQHAPQLRPAELLRGAIGSSSSESK